MNNISVWIGDPKPQLRRFTFVAGFLFENKHVFLQKGIVFVQNHYALPHLTIMFILENVKQTGDTISCRKLAEIRPGLSSRPDC